MSRDEFWLRPPGASGSAMDPCRPEGASGLGAWTERAGASGPSQEALDSAGIRIAGELGAKLPHDDEGCGQCAVGATGATGYTTYNRELDLSIGCLVDLLLHDAARLTSNDADWFRSRLTFIKQAWEHQNGKSS